MNSKAWEKVSKTIHDILSDVDVYTMKEFAACTDVSEQTLNRWHRSGKFEAKVVTYNNRIYRYYTGDMIAALQGSDLYKQLPKQRNSDLLGRTFGKLHVVDFTDAAKAKGYYGSYVCECSCGNTVEVPRSELLAGKAKSCGCRYDDLTGRTFGSWFVDGIAEPLVTPGGSEVMRYHCTCKCGTKRIIIARSLTNGRSASCGCFRGEELMSKAELAVSMYLSEHGLSAGLGDNKSVGFVCQKSFDDLLGVGGNRLSYDFYVQTAHYRYLIECQGGQHYFPVDLWGGQEAFEKQMVHDERKREYASNAGIPLIEVPHDVFTYDDVKKYLDDLIIL